MREAHLSGALAEPGQPPELESWRHLRAEAAPHMRGTGPLSVDHLTMRLEAEIAWHDRVIVELPTALARTDQETSS